MPEADHVQGLQCPICSAPLPDVSNCVGCGARFGRQGDAPVLIDFSRSIFRPVDYAESTPPVLDRRDGSGRLGRFLVDLTYGKNEVTPRLIDRFLAELAGAKRVLVIGGGTVGDGTQALYRAADVELVGTDVYHSPQVAVLCDAHQLPFADGSFDGVLVQAVLEHVVDPPQVVAEIHRVLRPEGVVYTETPFMQQVHEAAYDFTRYTFSGHRWLFRDFDEIEAGQVLGPGTALLWSIGYFARAIGLSQRLATLITAAFFWVRLLERGARRGPSLDAASGLYFLGRKAARPMQAHQLPGYYAARR